MKVGILKNSIQKLVLQTGIYNKFSFEIVIDSRLLFGDVYYVMSVRDGNIFEGMPPLDKLEMSYRKHTSYSVKLADYELARLGCLFNQQSDYAKLLKRA